VDWDAVERESFRRTGNEALLPVLTRAEASAKPQGRITIVDTGRDGAPEGVKGVRVSCNTFVKFAHAFTDEEGCYAMSKSFASQPRYRLVFQNSAGFEIGFNLLLTPASVSTLGKGEATGLDAEITQDSERKLFSRCVVNNAGYDFYQRCRKADPSVKTPPSNLRIWLFQRLSTGCAMMMQQGVLFEELGVKKLLGEYADLLKTFLPDLTIGLKGLDSYHDIYAQALHEFAHASHFMLAGSDYWEHYARFVVKSFVTSGFVTYGMGTEEDHGYCEVGEMWAYFCQTLLCRERYGSDVPAYGLNHWFRPQIFLMLEERGLGMENDHTGHGIAAIHERGRAFQYLDRAHAAAIYLHAMFVAPLLAFLTHAFAHHHYAVVAQASDDGFRDAAARGQLADTRLVGNGVDDVG
jgi:hypothetical protein